MRDGVLLPRRSRSARHQGSRRRRWSSRSPRPSACPPLSSTTSSGPLITAGTPVLPLLLLIPSLFSPLRFGLTLRRLISSTCRLVSVSFAFLTNFVLEWLRSSLGVRSLTPTLLLILAVMTSTSSLPLTMLPSLKSYSVPFPPSVGSRPSRPTSFPRVAGEG